MSLQLHDNEGVLYLNTDGTWSGQAMFHGVVFKVRGVVAVSPRGKTYMQLRAREKAQPEVKPIASPSALPDWKRNQLARGMANVEAMHGSGSRLDPKWRQK